MFKRVLIVAAHVGDFVWRSGGTIASLAQQGAQVELIALTYGLRGEANGYWKGDNATMEEGRAIREQEGREAARLLGASHSEFWGLEDYPLLLGRERVRRLAGAIRRLAPEAVITHDSQRDLFNTDHTLLGQAVYDVCTAAADPNIQIEGLAPVALPAILGFEPHVPELCGFTPRLYVDITKTVECKRQAMEAFARTQKAMLAPYMTKARVRAHQSGIPGCQYAEAFSMSSHLCMPSQKGVV